MGVLNKAKHTRSNVFGMPIEEKEESHLCMWPARSHLLTRKLGDGNTPLNLMAFSVFQVKLVCQSYIHLNGLQ